MSPPRLEMRGVRKRFGGTLALDGVDLSVAPGEVHALLGQNGAGKSTLMKILSGAHAPDEGTMTLDGHPYRPRSPLDARRLGVSMIYQELSLAPHLSVAENMALGLEPLRHGLLDRDEMLRRATAALTELGHPEIGPGTRTADLSPAQRQIVEIGRALASGCRVLVLDEPTSSLALRDAEALFALIQRLSTQGQAVLYISHFIEECRHVASRYTVLRDGRSAGGDGMADATPESIVDLMVGRRVDSLYPRSARRPGDSVLKLRDLDLRHGEVLGIAGLVGAGRTELLRELFDPPRECWARGLGFVSEDRKGEGLFLNLPIADNLTLTKLGRLVQPAVQHAATATWIERLGVVCSGSGQRIGELSGGNQQKIAIGRLLHHDVDVLLLDEPTRGIDVAAKAEIYRLLDELVTRQGKSAVLVSSYLPELLGLCDRIAVMKRGRLGPARPAEQCTEHGLLREASDAA